MDAKPCFLTFLKTTDGGERLLGFLKHLNVVDGSSYTFWGMLWKQVGI
jgi:hypothetical protein